MKRIASFIISFCTLLLLIFLFLYYVLFPSTFKTIFIIGIITISVLILYNFLLCFVISDSSDDESTQDLITLKEKTKETPIFFDSKKNKKTDSLENNLNEIFYPLQMIETAVNFISPVCEKETLIFATSLIQRNLQNIKEVLGEKIYRIDGKESENNIPLEPLESESFSLKESIGSDFSQNISIGIFGEPTSENLAVRLILQSYGFFTRLIESQQETISLIEDKLIQFLIILPKSEKDEVFNLCTKIREKFSLLDLPILLIVNKYRSYLIKKSYETQINDFLVRPFDVAALITKIKTVCDYRQLYLENQELLKSEKEKRTFLYFVTHNVNTPLTVLLNEIESSLDQSDSENQIIPLSNETLKNIQESANQINIIIQNVLNSYKISDGKILISPKIINLNDFAERENRILKNKANYKNQNFTFECKLKNPRVFCDENSLKGIYINLIDNAIKYTNFDGNISVKILSDDEYIHLLVIDDGQGIPKEKQVLLFNRFGNIGSKTTGKEKSVGLGLYVVNELCAMNNIKIEYSENSEAKSGSIFTLKFPKIG